MATTQEILDQLNGYGPGVGNYDGQNIWEDVINGLGIDKAATDEWDPGCASDRFVLDDGRKFQVDNLRGGWAPVES